MGSFRHGSNENANNFCLALYNASKTKYIVVSWCWTSRYVLSFNFQHFSAIILHLIVKGPWDFETTDCCLFIFFSGYISQAMKLGTQGSPASRVFSLEELKEATNNFDQSAFMGYGSIGKVTISI